MENYPYSYPESGDSSPRSREIDFESPPPWEDQQQLPPNYKVKFMCSYGGKIHPRPHDNQLSYISGETKILAVDRSIKFNTLLSKIAGLFDSDSVSFKYQLPGEDLDALISVTNDDDLEHMMNEYDRLFRASPKPARLRLFLFPVDPPAVVTPAAQVFGSSEVKSENDRFVDALNSGPIQASPPPTTVAPVGNADFLFGSEKVMPPPPPAVVTKVRDPIVDQLVHEQESMLGAIDDRAIATDPIQKHIQDMQRLRIAEDQGMYLRKSEDNLNNGGFPGEYYAQKVPEKLPPATRAVTVPGSGQLPTGYWPDMQIASGVYQATTLGSEQPVYVIPAHAGPYHGPPMGRPVTGPPLPGQGYYAVQRMPQEVYREQQQQQQQPQPFYNIAPPPAAAPHTLPPQGPPKVAAGYSEGMVHAQVALDNGVARQLYYAAAGGVRGAQQAPPPPQQSQPQYQAIPAMVSADMRQAVALNPESVKVIPKATQASF